MTTLSFDTLRYAKRMQSAGVEQGLAEEQAQALADALQEQHQQLVTREYLDLRLATTAADIKADIKTDIIKWVAGMLVAQAAVVATLVKLL